MTAPGPSAPSELACVSSILELMRSRHGVDFTAYRAATILRRLQNRVIASNAKTLPAYLARLSAEPAEAGVLLASLTIKVSRFFRNPAAFEVIRGVLGSAFPAVPPLAIWSAGCGRGEEAHSLAMLLDELELPAGPTPDIVGTDIDPAALAVARRGRYPDSALTELTPGLRQRYFTPENELSPRTRRRVEFRLQDLTSATAAPGGRKFHLICCRNTLIYFQPPLQERIERLLRDSLMEGGLLWLGEAEWPAATLNADFEVLDRKARLFRLAKPRSEGRP
ncbi:MAG: CheR family methyltransferase [Myxococcaceae bacterium]